MSKAHQVSSQDIDMDHQFFLKMAQKSQELQKQIELNSSCIQEIVKSAASKRGFENGKKQLEDSMKCEKNCSFENTRQSLLESSKILKVEKLRSELKSSQEDSTVGLEMDQSSVANVKSEEKDAAAGKRRKNKTLILKPIQETMEQDSVSKYAYKCVFQRCHDDLKFMKIGEKSEGDFLKSPEVLREVIYQIQNI